MLASFLNLMIESNNEKDSQNNLANLMENITDTTDNNNDE